MKKLSLKSGCSLLIAVFGAVLPLSAAQAAQDGIGGGTWSSGAAHAARRTAPEGPQGPVRTDMIDDTASSQNEPAEPARNWPENFDN